MRMLISCFMFMLSMIISEFAYAQACPQGIVDVPRGRGVTISINRTGAEQSVFAFEWIRDGNGYYTKDSGVGIDAEINKTMDYKITNAAAFAPQSGSELQVRVTGSIKDSSNSKCMGEAIVERMGDRTEIRFNATKGGTVNTTVTVRYQAQK